MEAMALGLPYNVKVKCTKVSTDADGTSTDMLPCEIMCGKEISNDSVTVRVTAADYATPVHVVSCRTDPLNVLRLLFLPQRAELFDAVSVSADGTAITITTHTSTRLLDELATVVGVDKTELVDEIKPSISPTITNMYTLHLTADLDLKVQVPEVKPITCKDSAIDAYLITASLVEPGTSTYYVDEKDK